MVNLGFSVLKKDNNKKADPPATRTPPLTPDDSGPSPPNHVMIRRRISLDNGERIIKSNDSLISELTFPQTTDLMNFQHSTQHDPPGLISRYSKADLDAALRNLNINQTLGVPAKDDPPEPRKYTSSMGESIVTRVLGIVDIGCVSPFADSSPPNIMDGGNVSSSASVFSQKPEWGIPPSDNTVDPSDNMIVDKKDRRLRQFSNEDNLIVNQSTTLPRQLPNNAIAESSAVVSVVPDGNQQEYLQLKLPPVPTKREITNEKVIPVKKSDGKSNWITKKFKSKSKSNTKNEGAQPRQKFETVLGIAPLVINSENEVQGIMNSPDTAKKIKHTNILPLAGNDEKNSSYEEKKDNNEWRSPNPKVSPFIEPAEFQRPSARNNTIDPSSPSNGKSLRKINTSKSNIIENGKSSTGSPTKMNLKSLSFNSKNEVVEDPQLLRKVKGGGQRFRKVFQQITKKDSDSRTSDTSSNEQNLSVDEDKQQNQNIIVQSSPSKSLPKKVSPSKEPVVANSITKDTKTTEVDIYETVAGEGTLPRLRKVLKSIKTSPTALLETVEEVPEEELSCTSATDLRVRIPGIHRGAPDAYISGRDLIGDEFVEEEIIFLPTVITENFDDEEVAAINVNTNVSTNDELMGASYKKLHKEGIEFNQQDFFIKKQDNIFPSKGLVENKTPFSESRDHLVPVLENRSFSPTIGKRNKSWKDYLGINKLDSHDENVNETPHLGLNIEKINTPQLQSESLTRHHSAPGASIENNNATNGRKSAVQSSHKPMWKAVIDASSGRTYYYHRKTRVTTWTKPPDEDIVKMKDVDLRQYTEQKQESPSKKILSSNIKKEPILKDNSSDVDPQVRKKKEDISRTLNKMVDVPSTTVVERLMQQYEGREDELITHIRDLSESKPFDEPIQPGANAGTPDDEMLADSGKVQSGIPFSGSSIALSRTMASIHSGFSGHFSSSTRISDQTQQVRNTASSKPGFGIATIQEDEKRVSTELSVHDDMPSPDRRRYPVQHAPIPKNIPVPRTRELTVEEFTTRDPVFGVKESDIRERKARGLQRQRRVTASEATQDTITYQSIDPNAYLGDIEDTDNDKETASVGPTDSVSALSEADLSFVTRQESLEITRRRALNEALSQKDWDRAADISETMRMDHLRQTRVSKLRETGEWTQSPLDHFVSENDWDAVATYIAQVRAKDLKAQRQLTKKSALTFKQKEAVIASTIRRSNGEMKSTSSSPTNVGVSGQKTTGTTPTHMYHMKDESNVKNSNRRQPNPTSQKQRKNYDGNSYSSYSSYSSYTSEYTSGSYYTEDEQVEPSSSKGSKREFAC